MTASQITQLLAFAQAEIARHQAGLALGGGQGASVQGGGVEQIVSIQVPQVTIEPIQEVYCELWAAHSVEEHKTFPNDDYHISYSVPFEPIATWKGGKPSPPIKRPPPAVPQEYLHQFGYLSWEPFRIADGRHYQGKGIWTRSLRFSFQMRPYFFPVRMHVHQYTYIGHEPSDLREFEDEVVIDHPGIVHYTPRPGLKDFFLSVWFHYPERI